MTLETFEIPPNARQRFTRIDCLLNANHSHRIYKKKKEYL